MHLVTSSTATRLETARVVEPFVRHRCQVDVKVVAGKAWWGTRDKMRATVAKSIMETMW